MDKKRAYEKPTLRAVRLDIRPAVLGTCNTSTITDAITDGIACTVTGCQTP